MMGRRPPPQEFSFSLGSPARGEHQEVYPAAAAGSSRAQAIAGYRREMLDLVTALPEAAYELSLRDIVDSRAFPLPPPPPNKAAAMDEDDSKKKRKKGKKAGKARKMTRMERSGLLINLFLPLSVSRKKVSPKPAASNSGNGGSSTNPPATTTTTRKKIGCCSFLMSNKSKNGGIKE